MATLTSYVALAIFPVAFALGFSFNPIEFSWAFHHGFEVMPQKLREKAMTIGRYSSFMVSALNLSFITLLANRNRIAAVDLGLKVSNWKANVMVGLAAGGLLIAIQYAVSALVSHDGVHAFRRRVRNGSVMVWVLIFVAGAFSEELWIAVCLVALRRTGHSIILSVTMTAAVFAIVHYEYRLAGAVAVGFRGTLSALLFLQTGSLVPPFLFHVVGNLGSLYRARHSPDIIDNF